jgi:hypothetical protein
VTKDQVGIGVSLLRIIVNKTKYQGNDGFLEPKNENVRVKM